MRIPALAFLALAAGIVAANAVTESDWRIVPPLKSGLPQDYPFQSGAAATTGAAGQAAYLRKTVGDPRQAGTLLRKLSLDAWRGKRVRLTLPVKLEGGSDALTWAWIEKRNGILIRAKPQEIDSGGAFQVHQFVLDIPDDAVDLSLGLRVYGGAGTVWADEARLEAVGADVALTQTARLEADGTRSGMALVGGGGSTYTPPNSR